MAENARSAQLTPLFIIDTCAPEDNQEAIKPPKQSSRTLLRSWSLPNCSETYKDLCGAVHYSFARRLNDLSKRSRSYPNNYLLNYLKIHEKYFPDHSPSTSVHLNLNRLDPNGGTQTPGGSSSRYSLYGSFFDLSESGYCPPSDQAFVKAEKKLLTIDGRPLLIVDHTTQVASNTYQDKCTDWLRDLQTNST